MFWPVEKVGIAERDVRCSSLNLTANVFQHDIFRHGKEAAFVHGRNRAMRA